MSQSSQIGGAPSRPVFQTATVADAQRGVLTFVLIVVILYFGREVLVPVTLALMLSFLLAPLVGFLRGIHLGRIPSVLLAVVLALVVLLGIGGVIGSQIADLGADLPKYVGQVEMKINGLKASTIGRLSHVVDRLGTGHGRPASAGQPAPAAQPAASPAPVAAGNAAPAAAQDAPAAPPPAASPAPAAAAPATPETTPQALVMRYLAPVLAPFATLGIVIVIAIFALLQQEDLRDRLIRLVGSDDIHRTTLALDDAGRRLSRYFLTQLAINSFFGVVIGVGLYFIGVPKPVLWGLLSTVLRFVPYVGSIISALLPIVLAAAVQPGWSMALWTAAFFILAEGVTGQALEPMLYGHSTGLSPFSVIVAAIFWSWVWGPIGLILSTPLTLCLVVMGRHVKRLEFLDVMLGDTPALTPVESFYQRILASDPDEALDQAELYLRQETLSNYYDKVALKAMQMAAYDAERGVLLPDQLAALVRTINVLVSNLEDHADDVPAAPAEPPGDDAAETETESDAAKPPDLPHLPAAIDLPPEWREPSAILCVAGRGPLDVPATAMLTQVLSRQHYGCRAVGPGEVERDAIRGLDVTGVKIACVDVLDISATAQLRYLVRRLRAHLPPRTPIIVGLWPVEDEALQDDRNRATIGADYFVSSFEDVLNTCNTLAQQDQPEIAPAPAVAK